MKVAYPQSEFGWPGVQAYGWSVRYRKNLSSGKEEETGSLWVAGAAFRWNLTAEQAAALLRGHWGIENRLFYVRDVTMDEDRLSGRCCEDGFCAATVQSVGTTAKRLSYNF